MKKIKYLIFIVLMILMGCSSQEKEIKTIEIKGNSSIEIGEIINFKAYNQNNDEVGVEWSVSSSRIASISQDGALEGLNEGTVTIQAVLISNREIKNTFDVTVTLQKPNKVIIDGEKTVLQGKTINLLYSISPSGLKSTLEWKSEDSNIAIVRDGRVTGVNGGVTNIILSVNGVDTKYEIEVVGKPTSITVEGKSEFEVGEIVELTSPDGELISSSDNENVAICEGTTLIGTGVGTTTIHFTAVSFSDVKATFDVTVSAYNKDTSPDPVGMTQKVNEILEGMSKEQLIGQLFVVGFNDNSTGVIPETDAASIKEHHFGNFIYMDINTKDPTNLKQLTKNVQNLVVSENGVSAFISVDQEGGKVTKAYNGLNHYIGNMTVAATNDPNNAYIVGECMSEELNNFGFNVDFAPVVDIANNPAGPIGNRCYADTAIKVSQYSSNMIDGLRQNNVISCVKHFPGHGDTATDTHLGLPTITYDLDYLHKNELVPYKVAIRNGIDMIMTTHIIFPAVDETYPATLSQKVLTDLLRTELKYDGVILTDALNMGAITSNFSTSEAAVLAINAGADILTYTECTTASVEAYNAILSAVNDGAITLDRIKESVTRILKLKYKYNIINSYYPKEDKDFSENKTINESLSKQSITLAKGTFEGLDPSLSTLFISPLNNRYLLGSSTSLTDRQNSFAYLAREEALKRGFTNVDYKILGVDSTSSINNILYGYDQIVIVTADQTGNNRVISNAVNLGQSTIMISMGKPYDIQYYTATKTYICAYEYTPLSVKTTIEYLMGDFIATGVASVNIYR